MLHRLLLLRIDLTKCLCYELVGNIPSTGIMSMSKQLTQRRKTKGPVTPKKTAGDKVFEVASELFYSQSIRGVGVETIVKEAGVAKISLYRNFASRMI